MSLVGFVRKEPVLTAALVLALASFLLVPPSIGTLNHIDFEVLFILLSFMVVVAGMESSGAFHGMAGRMLRLCRGRILPLCAALIILPFITSMLITNDVALITFVPVSMVILSSPGLRRYMIPVLVLQTIAANLGSSLTPFGNPQNLFIFHRYDLGLTEFMSTVGPYVLVGMIPLAVMMMIMCRGGKVDTPAYEWRRIDTRFLILMSILFCLCVCTVLDVIPCIPVMVLVILVMAVLRRDVLRKVDYGLILTFIFLFVFTGNLSEMDAVSEILGQMMAWDPMMTSFLSSQFISNVPAAVMLSGFTVDWQSLLIGVDVGGFGTPIASMASVITLRFYSHMESGDTLRYLAVFSLANVVMVLSLIPLHLM